MLSSSLGIPCGSTVGCHVSECIVRRVSKLREIFPLVYVQTAIFTVLRHPDRVIVPRLLLTCVQ